MNSMTPMTLEDFYDGDPAVGLCAQAWSPLLQALDAQAKQAADHPERDLLQTLPWIARLGKGADHGPEISLYRHVADVSFWASYLFYWSQMSTSTPKLSILADTDPVDALRIIITIALFHDADKYCGADSSDPTLDQVAQVWQDLGGVSWIDSAVWPQFSLQALSAAVDYVEKRGQTQALRALATPSAEPLPPRIARLAGFVAVADNFLGRIREYPAQGPLLSDALDAVYRERLPLWHQEYGVPLTPLEWITLSADIPILRHIFQRATTLFYPIFAEQNGDVLRLALPPHVTRQDFADGVLTPALTPQFTPTFSSDTKSVIALQHCHTAHDVISIATSSNKNITNKLQKFMVVKLEDLSAIQPFLEQWRHDHKQFAYNVLWDKPVKKETASAPLWEWNAQGADTTDPYVRAIACALAVGHYSSAEWTAWIQQFIQRDPENAVHKILRSSMDAIWQQYPRWAQWDALTQRTMLSLAWGSALTDETLLPQAIDVLHGEFPQHLPEDRGAIEHLDCLKRQLDLLPPTLSPSGYALAESDSSRSQHTCLICGQLTTNALTQKLDTPNVKSSAFSNRLGHRKNLQATKGENFICEGCLYTMALMTQHTQEFSLAGTAKKEPTLSLTVVSPHHAAWYYPEGQDILSVSNLMRDASPTDSALSLRFVPWQQQRALIDPYSAESFPLNDTRFKNQKHGTSPVTDSQLDQIVRYAHYALWSGEPVHVFRGRPYAIVRAFFYEPMPPWLRDLTYPAYHSAQGVSRENLPAFVHRVTLFRDIAFQHKLGAEVLRDLPYYGWLAVAYLAARIRDDDDTLSQDIKNDLTHQIHQVKEWFPMVSVSDALTTAATYWVAIDNVNLSDSTSQMTWGIRLILEDFLFQQNRGIADDPTLHQYALSRLIHDQIKRDALAKRSEEYLALNDNISQFVATVYTMIQSLDDQQAINAKMQRYLYAAFAYLVRETVSQRIARALESKAKQAALPGASAL